MKKLINVYVIILILFVASSGNTIYSQNITVNFDYFGGTQSPNGALGGFQYENIPYWVTISNIDQGYGYYLTQITCAPNTELARLAVVNYKNFDNSINGTYNIQQSQELCLQVWYLDSDQDGYGNLNSTPILSCTDPYDGSGVNNNVDYCPSVYSTVNNGCEAGYIYEDMNWISSKTFDITGATIASNKSYFDELGKGIQSQSIDIKTGHTWASQTMYDSQGRPALQSLSAPINITGGFLYNPDFIKKSDGITTYTSIDFETTIESPESVGDTPNTLGWYYSESNTNEPYQDITAHPFSRTVYSELNPGAVLKSIGGNKVDVNNDGQQEWVNGFSYTLPAAQEMYYVFGKDKFPVNSDKEKLEQLLEPNKTYFDQSSSPATHYGYRYASSSACLDIIVGNETHYGENIKADFPLEIGKIYKIIELGYLERYIQIMNAQPYGTTYNTTAPDFILTEGSWDSCEEFNKHLVMEARVASILAKQGTLNWLKITKTIVQDIDGNESVVFTDTDGKIFATARSGGAQHYEVISLVGKQEFIDVHIPIGCENTLSFLGADRTDFDIFNLRTEAKLANNENITAGFYRIQYVGSNKTYLEYPALSYITETNTIDRVFTESIGVKYEVNYFDYSLNYYDRVGRLTKSTQPLGFDDTALTSIKTMLAVNHNLSSLYTYNVLGQLIYSKSPDEGEAWFKYRKDGQIRFSQNSKQALAGEFSYTNYDNLGRPMESGVVTSTFDTNLDPNGVLPTGVKKEQQHTTYDVLEQTDVTVLSTLDISYHNPTFLAGNVAKTSNDNTTTYYSYDIYGRVKWIVQYINGLGTKTIDYEYDPITSAVISVDFQRYKIDERFIHQYTYNDVNELVKVETSTDNTTFTTHADYEYYENGSLRRVDLAEGLQGIDYVYNLAGQLKSINHPSLEAAKDPGGDVNDLFGMAIDYHKDDYKRSQPNITSTTFGIDQYNGNIKAVRWNNDYNKLTNAQNTYSYQYNNNNWLISANYGEYSSNGFVANSTGDYGVTGISYDANGNIQTLNRTKNTESGSNAMDNFTYHYKNDKPNQLDRVEDTAPVITGADDLKTQTAGNYIYNAIGQLTENTGEAVKYFYNTSGLVTEVQKNNIPLVKFFYNDKGQRVRKEAYSDVDGTLIKTEYYVRDAAGSVLAIYNGTTQKELPIYGASRLGVFFKTSNSSVYQLTDHLGNVRAVIAKDGQNNAVATTATDYYPFGMPMPNRQMVGGELYRYSFQGQEKDPETGKEAFQLRLWDGRIGRWLTTDPYGQFFSPYLGMGNNPISSIDPDGGCVDKNGNDCFKGNEMIGARVQDGGGNWWSWDGETANTMFAFKLNEVLITGQTTEHARLVNSPIVKSMHSAQREFGIEFLGYLSVVNPWSFAFGGASGFANLGKNGFTRAVAAESSNLWKVGEYSALRGLEVGLEAHHVGQKAIMKKFVANYNVNTAPSILVPKVGHTMRGPLGRLSTKISGIANPRQLLARDIFELRRVYGTQNIHNNSLIKLIKLNKEKYPSAFIK